jgi:hypothetical protein
MVHASPPCGYGWQNITVSRAGPMFLTVPGTLFRYHKETIQGIPAIHTV